MLIGYILREVKTFGNPALSISKTSEDAVISFLIKASLIRLLASFTRNPAIDSFAYPKTASVLKISLPFSSAEALRSLR